MTEKEKPRLKALEEKSEYALWSLRVEDACNATGLTAAFT